MFFLPIIMFLPERLEGFSPLLGEIVLPLLFLVKL